VHCPDGPLCGECLAELERLRPTARATGEQLADLLASHVVPDLPWVETLDETSEPILKRARPLSRDDRIVRELAAIVAHAARSRWEALREARMKK
jgi:hypothetical protein